MYNCKDFSLRKYISTIDVATVLVKNSVFYSIPLDFFTKLCDLVVTQIDVPKGNSFLSIIVESKKSIKPSQWDKYLILLRKNDFAIFHLCNIQDLRFCDDCYWNIADRLYWILETIYLFLK